MNILNHDENVKVMEYMWMNVGHSSDIHQIPSKCKEPGRSASPC